MTAVNTTNEHKFVFVVIDHNVDLSEEKWKERMECLEESLADYERRIEEEENLTGFSKEYNQKHFPVFFT